MSGMLSLKRIAPCRLLYFLAAVLVFLGTWISLPLAREVVNGLHSYRWPVAELVVTETATGNQWSYFNAGEGRWVEINRPRATVARDDRDWEAYSGLFEMTQQWWAGSRKPMRVYVDPADPVHPVLVRGIPPQSSGRLLLTTLLLVMGLRLALDARRAGRAGDESCRTTLWGESKIPPLALIAALHLGSFALYCALAFGWTYVIFVPIPGLPALLVLAGLVACELVPGLWQWIYSFEAIRSLCFQLLLVALLPITVALLGLGLPFILAAVGSILLLVATVSLVQPKHLPASLTLLIWTPLYVAGCAAAFRALCYLAYRLQPLIPYHAPPELLGNVTLVARFDVLVGVVGVAVALGTVALDTFWRLRQARQLANLPTSRARSAALGIAEFRGRACRIDGAAGEVLSWRMGGTQRLEPFYLEDESGRILIDPRGATFRVSRASSYGGRIVEIVLTRRTTQPELTRPLTMQLLTGDPIYVIGNVTLNPDTPAGALGSERLVVKPLVEPGITNVFVSLLLGRGNIPAARRIEHVFFLSDGSERLARRHILKGLAEIWPKALLAAALSALLIAQQLPRARGGIEQWSGMELLRAPIAEATRIDLLVDYLLGTSAAAQRERTTPLRNVIYLRELLRVRGIIEETQITNYLWNNVRSESYHFAAPALTRLLQEGRDPELRRFAAWALGRVKASPELVLPLLLAALADDSPKMRISALQSLAQVAPDARPEVVAAMIAATRDPDPGVVRIALFALRETRGLPVDKVLPVAVDLLTHEDYYLRHEAANVLARLKEGALPALDPLRAALSDPEEIVRNSAAAAIAAIGPPAAPAVPELIAALRDPKAGTRMFAARALGAIGPAAADALPALEAARNDTSDYTRREIESAIRQVNRP